MSQKVIGNTSGRVSDEDFKDAAKKNPKDFTRKRKMGFEELMLFMLMNFKCTAQSALRRFFSGLGVSLFMRQQSFSEARYKIRHEAFQELFHLTGETMVEELGNTWHGFRVLAFDGSKINLPSDDNLLAYFGANGRGAKSPQAQGSVCYDVLNDIVIDADIAPLATCERTLALSHIAHLVKTLPNEKKLAIFDRGYPSFDMIRTLEDNNFHYVMRVKKKFNSAIDSQTKTDGYVWLEKDVMTDGIKTKERIHTRVIKFMLDSGEQEVLITNITDRRLGKNAFKKLYFMRWPVEIKYDTVKNKLEVENFTARTVEGIKQDFFATMYLVNVAACCKYDAQAKIEVARCDKDNKYTYQANTNELIGVLKDRFIMAFTQDDSDKQMEIIRDIVDEISLYVVPKREGRSVPRNPNPRGVKFHHNRKSNC